MEGIVQDRVIKTMKSKEHPKECDRKVRELTSLDYDIMTQEQPSMLPRNQQETFECLKSIKTTSFNLNRKLSIVLQNLLDIGLPGFLTNKPKKKKPIKLQPKKMRRFLSKETKDRLYFPILNKDPFFIPPPRKVFIPFPNEEDRLEKMVQLNKRLKMNKKTPKKKKKEKKKINKKKKKKKKKKKWMRSRFDKRTSSFRSLVKFVRKKRNHVERNILKKHSIARINRETRKKLKKDGERKVKLGFFIAFSSRMAIFEYHLNQHRSIRRNKEIHLAAKTVANKYLFSFIKRRRNKSWRSAFSNFRKHFVFYRLYLKIKKKKDALLKVKDFLSNVKHQNFMFLVIRNYVAKIRKIQMIWRARIRTEKAKIMLNFLKWTKLESEIIINRFPKEEFLSIENDERYKNNRNKELDKKELEKGSFTFIIPPPSFKFAVLRRIIREDFRRCFFFSLCDYYKDSPELYSEPIVLIDNQKLEKLCLRGLKKQKILEVQLREDIFEDEYNENQLSRLYRRIQIEYLSDTLIGTASIIRIFFGKMKFSILIKLARGKMKHIAMKRMNDIYYY